MLLVSELVRPGVPTISPHETIDTVLAKFTHNVVDSLPIANPTDTTRIEGIITRQAVITRYQEELDRQTG